MADPRIRLDEQMGSPFDGRSSSSEGVWIQVSRKTKKGLRNDYGSAKGAQDVHGERVEASVPSIQRGGSTTGATNDIIVSAFPTTYESLYKQYIRHPDTAITTLLSVAISRGDFRNMHILSSDTIWGLARAVSE